MNRERLRQLGIELPMLPTTVCGALPGEGWPERLMRAGVDIISSGAARDTPTTWRAAAAAAPHRPVAGRGPQTDALVAAGCRLLERGSHADAYGLLPDADAITVVGDGPEVEDPNRIAWPIVVASRERDPAAVLVVAGPGLDRLEVDLVERKLAAMVEAAVQARLAMAKNQFDL